MDEGVEIALCKAVIERGDQVELDPGDINVRMTNWDTRQKRTQPRSDPVKRKENSEEESDTDRSAEEENEVKEISQPTKKKRRMDCTVQKVKPG